ncbi:MAG: hypothetical protein KIT52_15455 [Anaerolineae bacterium]|nr:hypothetical protein [Anaerolineae bacterium]
MTHSPHSPVIRAATALVLFAILVVGMGAWSQPVAAAPTCTTDCYVSPTGNDANDGATAATPLLSIQLAVNTVQSDGTVHLAAGTYAGDTMLSSEGWRELLINKPLTMLGAGSATTIVQFRPETTGIEIEGNVNGDITFEGIAFTKVPANTDAAGFNIRFVEWATKSFDVVTFTDVVSEYASGRNVYLGSSGTYNEVVVTDSTFNYSGVYGFTLNGTVSKLTVTNSTFSYNGRTDKAHGVGLALESGTGVSNVLIEDSTFTNNGATATNGGAGIAMTYATDVTIDNVNVSGSYDGIKIWEFVNKTSNVLIQDSTASGNRRGILFGSETGKTIENVTIIHNDLSDNIGSGVLVYRAASPFDGVIDNVIVNRNDLTNNLSAGLNTTVAYEEVDGTCNWWGALDGPGPANVSSPATGSGAKVSANVDYTPWLYTADLDGPCYIGGTIGIDKVAIGGGATAFEFDVSWSATNVMLTDGDTPYVTTPPLAAGTYSISEVNLPPLWTQQSATCDNAATPATETIAPSSITVADGDAWVCTFTNASLPLCTTVCYADAVGGSDADDGVTPATAFKTIQKAIDTVQAGGQVRVLPGNYSETATGRDVLGSGSYQFGLFFEETAKDGVTLQGVTAADVNITDPSATQAVITTNATNNFGYSGVFVEADDVTIAGVAIGDNTPSNNKTIEVIGDGFTFKDSFMNVSDGGSLYFGDWRYNDTTDVSYIQSYTVDNNIFADGSSVDIASGAGYTGPVAGRTITNNEFSFSLAMYTAMGNVSWPNISFNGDTTTVPWYAYPVGGAVITGNAFTNNAPDGRHIRTRGIANDAQFDWASYWNNNTFNKAVIVGPNLFDDVRSYVYTSGSYTMNDVRQIGAVIQPEIDHAVDGDTVLVNEGTYPESPTVNKSVTLRSEDGRNVTFIELQTGTNYTHSLLISGEEVTVQGFTIVGIDAACPTTLAATNIYLNRLPDTVVIKDNRVQVGAIDGACSTGDDGFGLITEYSASPDVATLTVENNIFEPLNAAGQRAFYINPSVVNFVFRNNQITGQFNGTAITQAQTSLIENNTVTGTGTSAGLGVWGEPDPAVWGHATIQGNTISGTANAVTIYEAQNVTVTKNVLNANTRAVRVLTVTPLTFDKSTIHINRNALTNNTSFGIDNQLTETGDIDGTCNWWNAASGPGPVGPGAGDKVSAKVDFTPWLYSSNLDGPCYVGGTISIDKVAAGGGATQFTFDVSWSVSHVSLTDAGAPYVTNPPLQAGNYSIVEINLPSGWSQQSATCDNTATTPVETVNPSSITVANGDAWACTFTNVYTPPPSNTCAVPGTQYTDLLGIGMGNTKKHKATATIKLPNYTNLVDLYGQLVAKVPGDAKYVRFIMPGKNNYVQVNAITAPSEHQYGNFWYGADIPWATTPPKQVKGQWFLQKSGTKNHIPRAFVLYATYQHATNRYVNVWDTFTPSEGEVYWDVAQGWTPTRVLNVPIAAPLGPTTFNVEVALVDNDKDARPVWVTVTAGNVSQTQQPTNPSNGEQLNLMTFTLANVPAGTNQIVIKVYSPSPTIDGVDGDSATLVGMAANYLCAPITNAP